MRCLVIPQLEGLENTSLHIIFSMSSTMEAVRVSEFGGPQFLKLEKDVPIPNPGDGEVLVRVRAVGINPVEALVQTGQFAIKPDLPYTPGHDAAGEVAALGNGVTGVKVGDRVYTFYAKGSYAQYTLAKANEVVPIPESLSFEQGAALPLPYLTAYRALFTKSQAKSGETLLIHGGTGGVGLAAIQLGLARGLRVLATGGTQEGIDLMKKLGVHGAFNHRQAGYLDEIRAATDGKGVDMILENVANVNLDADLGLLTKFGRITIVGNKGRVDIDPSTAMLVEAAVFGILIYLATPEEMGEAYKLIESAAASGHVNPVIGKRFTLAQASEAQADIMNNKGTLGKSVFVVD